MYAPTMGSFTPAAILTVTQIFSLQTYYSDIEISCEQDATTIDHLSLRDAMFLPVANENPWKRVWNTWRV